MTFKQPALVNSPTSPVWKKPSESASQTYAKLQRATMQADCQGVTVRSCRGELKHTLLTSKSYKES